MLIDHVYGYKKHSIVSAIIPKGAAGAQDDLYVYGIATIKKDGVFHHFYSGTRQVTPDERDSRLYGQVFLATSSDGKTCTKYGIVIPRTVVSPAKGLTPFDVKLIDGTYYMLCSVFGYSGRTYALALLTSSDLVSWSWLGYITGLDVEAHGGCIVEDPSDPTKVILYYTSMVTMAHIKRAILDKSAMTVATGNMAVTNYPSIYPSARWEGDRWRMMFAMPVGDQYRSYATASLDGLSFPHTNLLVSVPGPSGAWDSGYNTTPHMFEDKVYYSARFLNGSGYIGIGVCDLEDEGGIIGWDWTQGGVGPVNLPASNGFGMELVGGSKGMPAAFVHTRGSGKRYELTIYDSLNTASGFQNTFRVTNQGNLGPVIGINRDTSASKYVYRLTGSSPSWVITPISRTAGLHVFTFDVTDAGTDLKIDGVTVATDTAFDPLAYFTAGAFGYVGGTGLVKSFEITDL